MRGRIFPLLIVITCLVNVYGNNTSHLTKKQQQREKDDDCIFPGSTVQIQWKTERYRSIPNNDWIGIYPSGVCTDETCPSGSTAWSYVTVADSNGTTSVTIPPTTTPGKYSVYYLVTTVAPYNEKKAVTITPGEIIIGKCNMTLFAVPESGVIFQGGVATVAKWINAQTSSQDDWIAYFTSSTPSSTTLVQGSWEYTYGGTVKKGLPPDPTGIIKIPTPSNTGTYFLYYCLNNGYTCPISQVITVGPTVPFTLTVSTTTPTQSMIVNVTWSGVDRSGKNDWIGFFTTTSYSSDNLIHDAWVFTYGGQTALDISPPSSGTIAVPVPPLPGSYFVVYCLQNSYNCANPIKILVGVTPPLKIICRKTPQTSIEHIVLVVPENHSFDSILGRYCTAKTGSNPTCNIGPNCCEAAPDTVDGVSPTLLDDDQNDHFDPSHSQSTMLCENNQGQLDQFISGCPSSSPSNFAIASSKTASSYFTYAAKYSISDHFFQSISGASSANDMYFISGKFLFTDNNMVPLNASMPGSRCYSSGFASYYQTTVLDLLEFCGFSWKIYAEGWDVNPKSNQCYPNFFDSSDFGASYFPSLTKNPGEHWRDFSRFTSEVSEGTLPVWSYVKGLGINSEHPGEGTLSAGANIIDTVVNAIMNSDIYKKNTLILWTPDESGGYYDHIQPPLGYSPIDGQPYGPRTPLLAIGFAVKNNWVSHVQMEPSSIIKFVEWNWLGSTGQLGVRDTVVANIGSLLDPNRTIVPVPEF